MSIDNVLAVAGASKENLFLLLFGLGLSIPLMVLTGNLFSPIVGPISLSCLYRVHSSGQSGGVR